jgi:His/Glu/Gln/Arg/opine family amino acid ABC transporter permease subunit
MATTSPEIKPQASIPFWRDVRVLGVIAQLIALVLVLAGIGWLISNFLENAETQGLKIGFDFLNTTAAFDISEGIEYAATDSFGRALWVGVVNTIRVSALGIVLTTLLGTLLGVARLSNNWLISRIATVYIEIIRNIPLLVLLFFLYFAVILKLPPVKDSIQPFGFPVFLNQRGVTIPSLEPSVGFPVWLAFVVLAIIFGMALWTIQSRQEEKTGESANKTGLVMVSLLVIALGGWLVTTSFISDQSFMTTAQRNAKNYGDFEALYMLRVDEDALKEAGMDTQVADSLNFPEDVANMMGSLTRQIEEAQETDQDITALEAQLDILDEAEIVVCGVKDSIGVINAASQMRRNNIKVKVSDEDSIRKAGENYGGGDCDLLAASNAELAAERALLEDPNAHDIVPTATSPLVVNTPAPAGFNIQGGNRLSPEFAALLAGLTIYTSAFAAEIVRAGILAVSKGQSEAARALGLTEGQRLRLIVLPQAMRVIIPPMTSQYLNLTKNSSLAIAIGFPDLVAVGNTVLNQSGFAVQVILVFMASYLTMSLSISAFLNWYNKKVALVER